LGFVPYQPLENGMLTGKYRRGAPAEATTRLAAWGEMFPDLLTDDSFATIERLQEYAVARGHTLHELALAWLASKPVVASVIAGATSPEQVSANAAAMTGWDLTPEEVAGIERLTDPSRAFTGYRYRP
jgi:aryl-alcohol dehydrogenase-like predicted oxidoreductase